MLCERRRHVPAVRKTKGRRRRRAGARDVPGIKTRRRHCWEERPQNATGSICPVGGGGPSVGARGNADRRAENLDFDGGEGTDKRLFFSAVIVVENRWCQGLLFLFTLCVKMQNKRFFFFSRTVVTEKSGNMSVPFIEIQCLISVYRASSLSEPIKPPGLPVCVLCCGLSTLCLHSTGFNTLPVFLFIFPPSEPCNRSSCKRYSHQNTVVSEEVITN